MGVLETLSHGILVTEGGACDYPAATDVRAGVVYGGGTGTLRPAMATGAGGSANKRITVQRRAAGTDSSGHPNGAYAALKVYSGRLGNITESDALEGAAPTFESRVWLPAGAVVGADDRLLIDGEQWAVMEILPSTGPRTWVRCIVRRVG